MVSKFSRSFDSFCRNFAKKTLIKTARKAGIKTKHTARKPNKYVLPTPPQLRKSISSWGSAGSDSESDRPNSEIFDDLSSEYSV